MTVLHVCCVLLIVLSTSITFAPHRWWNPFKHLRAQENSNEHSRAIRSSHVRVLFSRDWADICWTSIVANREAFVNVIWIDMRMLFGFTSLRRSSLMMDRCFLSPYLLHKRMCIEKGVRHSLIDKTYLRHHQAVLSDRSLPRSHKVIVGESIGISFNLAAEFIFNHHVSVCVTALADRKGTSLPQVKYFLKRLHLYFGLHVEMSGSSSKDKTKDIWSKIDLVQLTKAIASLGNRIKELESETWRLNGKTRANDSVWNELILSLNLDATDGTRRSLYNVWQRNRHNIRDLVAMQTMTDADDEISDLDDADAVSNDVVSVSSRKQLALQAIVSSPTPVRPKRQLDGENGSNGNGPKKDIRADHSVVFSADEWKKAYSQTNEKMKTNWTNIFANRLTERGFACTLRFKTPCFKEGDRKKNCRFLFCYAKCTTTICTRVFHIILQKEPSEGTSVLFLVRTFGEANHDAAIETAARHLKGEELLVVGAYAHSPYSVYLEYEFSL